jgi:hypothetical protein
MAVAQLRDSDRDDPRLATIFKIFPALAVCVTALLIYGCRKPDMGEHPPPLSSTRSIIPNEAVIWGCGADNTCSKSVSKAAAASVDELPGPPDCNLTPQETLQNWKAQGKAIAWFQKFPEVMSIWNRGFTEHTGETQLCTGTLIAPLWVLTAGHCFLGNYTSAASLSPGHDYETDLSPKDNVALRAGAAITLEPEERERHPVHLIVDADFTGQPEFHHDLALLRLERPFPSNAVHPARLAERFDSDTTVIGYGYSETGVGTDAHATAGSFSMSWPPPVNPKGESRISFVPESADSPGMNQRFCPGDSGGPVFAGRYRGCKLTDRAAEPQPHLLEGVVSYYEPGKDAGLSILGSCDVARREIMQSVIAPENHAWICQKTKGEANGC